MIPGGITHDSRHLTRSRLRRAGPRGRGSGTWTATSTSTTGWATARSSSVTATRRWSRRCTERSRAARTTAPATSWRSRGPSWSATGPSAERVRFTMLGHRGHDAGPAPGPALHRPAEDRQVRGPLPRLARRRGHRRAPSTCPTSAGVPGDTPAARCWSPPNDLAAVARLLGSQHDVAAVILEPGGGTGGPSPSPGVPRGRCASLPRTAGGPIFDEVITGFRYAPGGVQEQYGVTPT